MRKHGIDMWVVPMREYNEDPVFSSITAPETFAARRRTIYVFFDKVRRRRRQPQPASSASRSAARRRAGVFEARRSTKAAAGDVGRGQQAELWGDEQWQVLKSVIEERKPRIIGIDRSTVFAFSDGLSSGELKGMSAALGDTWTSRFKDAEGLPLELIASRLPEEEAFYTKMQDARLVDDADDVLERGHHPGQDEDERPRLVVAAARQRPGARHVVPAERRRCSARA